MNEDNAAARVIDDLRAFVRAGQPGDRLPSVRALMARHRASPVTVQQAIQRVAGEGLVEVRSGRGSFIAARPAPARLPDLSWQSVALSPARPGEDLVASLISVPRPETLPLSSGYLDPALLPVEALGAALGRAARRPAAWGRVPLEGRDELRAWFAREAGGEFRAGDMLICPGAQAALSAVFRGLTEPGDTVLLEAPTYLGAIAVARDAGLRVVPVPTDADGVRPDLLATAFDRTGARLFYCQPLHANPHGAVLSAERRPEVFSIVRAAGAFLVEDDWARGFTIDGVAPPTLASEDVDGHVVHVRSLTKVAAPGLRVAVIGARGQAGIRLRTARSLDDFYVSGPLQEAAIDFVTSPVWRRHLRSLQGALRSRRDALLSAMRSHLPDFHVNTPSGGLHAWARLPDGIDDLVLTNAAEANGVVVFPGRSWFAGEPPGSYVRLTFGAAPEHALAEGVQRLAEVTAAIRRSARGTSPAG
ncbi:PLP-dependent aminotransferase family protein [Kibdelosporangium phytohabitans]|uniref:GntR family transcriptional regulator n=1 Tax=Kibdelosporangium phytohabitans TaxID=860235 RepID=A0A0N9ID02_9PSEU|nr:PLP-dependent aminotransferase family protein [Kibdelosporangium phytohabitans]ALG12907.1 GntR family transcriptional regulator [Kibdelosporangium phytohabitans]MBE1464613.1 DNA-binding transcriptional MocR family regulator [Kibdelosporangium phytohabitans]